VSCRMDPWADSTTTWSPTEEIRPSSQYPTTSSEATSPFKEGPVDPWAEPTSSSSIPVATSHHDEREESPAQTPSGSGGDFDPWSGNSAPIAPLSSAYQEREPDEEKDEDVEDRDATGWSPEISENDIEEETTKMESDKPATGDDDDPWGSGAAAKRIKAEQDAEAVSL
jgi:hypothetical protein